MQKEITSVITVDDLDGETTAETRGFEFEGAAYEIDLNGEHYENLREVLEGYHSARASLLSYVNVARPVTSQEEVAEPEPQHDEVAKRRTRKASTAKKAAPSRKSSTRKSARKTASPTPAEIRAWALENNVPVSSTGRVGKETRQAYLEAHSAA